MTLRARNMRAPGGLDRALAAGVQMIADSAPPRVTPYEIATLDEGDRNQIYRLAQQAKPGPFARQTHRLGTFLGIKQGGTLVAMAGQRLKLPGFTEISAVCVAPGHRGQGLAAALVSEMMHRIIAAGDQPFLHAYADNTAAIALYRRLSFRVRTRVQVSCWTHASLAETG
ncbi:MAG: GNAT family N-acetyltransferase [Pseudomonadota bacterium]